MARIRSRELETGSVNRRVIDADAVGRRQLGRWAVGGANFAPGSVGYPQMQPGAVQAPQLAPSAVEAPNIAPGAVTAPAIADGAVTGPKVPVGALGARELADGSITIPKFMKGSRPVQLVDTLPVLPDDDHPPGAVVVNLADGKVYRHHAPEDVWGDTWDADWPTSEGWTAQVDTYDLRGLIEEGQIGEGAVVAGTVAANAIGATELAAIYVEVDKWIRSFNWNPGVAGWAIDGEGTAEFNQITVRNGVLVGGTLTAAALKSADYSAGSAGWALDPSGNTELNDVTIRGSTVVGGTVTAAGLVSSGYSPGSSGWALDANGNAELNDATFRGNIKASSVTSGQLVSANYDPGSAGWALDANGNAELNDVTIRGGAMVGGTVSGATVTGATIQTASSGKRVVLSNADELSYYDTSDRLRGKVYWSSDVLWVNANPPTGTASDLGLNGSNLLLSSFNDNVRIHGRWLSLWGTTEELSLRTGESSSGIELQSRPLYSTASYNGFAGSFFRNSSSRRYKDDIIDAPDGALDTLRQLRVRRFRDRRNSRPDRTTGPERAGDVASVEQLTSRSRAGLVVEELPDGLAHDDGYDLSEMLALTIKSVQELDRRLEAARA